MERYRSIVPVGVRAGVGASQNCIVPPPVNFLAKRLSMNSDLGHDEAQFQWGNSEQEGTSAKTSFLIKKRYF